MIKSGELSEFLKMYRRPCDRDFVSFHLDHPVAIAPGTFMQSSDNNFFHTSVGCHIGGSWRRCSLTGVLDLSIDALLNSSDGEDKSADEMRQLYLSCPSEARETLLNATRTLSHELKKLMDKSTDQADSSF